MIKQKTLFQQLSSVGTRDAVETAIDLSKGLKKTTWETLAKKYSNTIPNWSDTEPTGSAIEKPESHPPTNEENG